MDGSGWLWEVPALIESFPFRMSPTVNRDNHEVVLSDFALCLCVTVNSSYIKSFAVNKLLAAAAPKP